MTTEASLPKIRYGITGYIILVMGLAGISAFLLVIWQDKVASWGITKHMAWTIWGGVFSFLLILVVAFYFLQRHQYKKEQAPYNPESTLPHSEKQNLQTISTASQFPPVTEIRNAMRYLYNRRWASKIRILLVTGAASDVERLTPGLTSQYWQEDKGTLLLWGDAAAYAGR